MLPPERWNVDDSPLNILAGLPPANPPGAAKADVEADAPPAGTHPPTYDTMASRELPLEDVGRRSPLPHAARAPAACEGVCLCGCCSCRGISPCPA